MQIPDYPKSLPEALAMIRSKGWASAEELAIWARVNISTVYSWSEVGGPDPHFHSIQRIYRLCRDERISSALAHAFLAGGPVSPALREVNPGPATIEGIKSDILKTYARTSESANTLLAALQDGTITAEELVEFRRAVDAAHQALDEELRAAEAKAEADAKKKITGPRLSASG